MSETPVAEKLGYTAKVAPELREYVRPLTDAQLHPDNVRKHTIEKIAQSLEQHGQRALVIVQASSGFIVKGNGTYDAAKLLGWDSLAMSFQDMNDSEALGFLYADNRASDKASYDREKLYAGLKKMQEGPGLFDSLWEIEEFEDLDEEFTGSTVLEPTGTTAKFVGEGQPAAEKEQSSSTRGSQGKMREVPITLTLADHAVFIERLRLLQKRYETGGIQATIFEAIRRQAEAEGATVATGKAVDDEALKSAVRSALTELRDIINSQPPEAVTVSRVLRLIEAATPAVALAPAEQVPGQMAAFFEEPVSAGADEAPAGDGVVGAEDDLAAVGQVDPVPAQPAIPEPAPTRDPAAEAAALFTPTDDAPFPLTIGEPTPEESAVEDAGFGL